MLQLVGRFLGRTAFRNNYPRFLVREWPDRGDDGAGAGAVGGVERRELRGRRAQHPDRDGPCERAGRCAERPMACRRGARQPPMDKEWHPASPKCQSERAAVTIPPVRNVRARERR